jgi:hypothetical protein
LEFSEIVTIFAALLSPSAIETYGNIITNNKTKAK